MRHFILALLIPILLLGALSAASPAQAGVNWWTPVGPEGGWIADLAVDPQTKAVYAATSGGVFVSTNGAGTWERRNRGVHGVGVVSRLAVSSIPAQRVYVAGEAVYWSADGGLSWTPGDAELFGGGVHSMAADPTDSSVVYAGTPYNGVLKSSDGGASWTQVFVDVDGSCGPIHSLAIDRRAPSTIYAACGYNRVAPFIKSTNGGATWVAAAPLPHGGYFLFLVLDSGTPGVVYVTASVDLDGHYGPITYKSSDDGASWTRFGLPGVYMLPGPPGVLFMGKHRSTDGGATWQELTLPTAPSALAFAPDDPATLYVGTAPPPIAGVTPSGVYKSTDAGATWTMMSRGLFATSIRVLEITPQSALYTLALPTGLLKRERNADRWQRADAGLSSEVFWDPAPLWSRPLAIDPQAPANLYLETRDGLLHSSNGGAAWTLVSQCVGISYLLIDPQDPDRLFALGRARSTCPELSGSCSVFQSDDAGASWSCISQPGFSRYADGLVLDSSQPSRLYVLRRLKNNIWTTPDRGRTWGKLKLPRHLIDLTTLTVDPRDSRRLYLGTSEGRVYKTTNRGSSWTEISRGLPVGFYEQIWQIVVDPQRPQTVYVAHTSGVYITGNGGSTWHPLNGGLPGAPWVLVLDPQNPRKLYAATYGSGVYAHERR
jgi:photosystem II stability/assembly factor-like uncharacterized protein